MCTFICTHTESCAGTDKQTNKFLTLWKFTQTKREARRQKSRRQSKERQREQSNQANKCVTPPSSFPLSLSLSVQSQSHAAPHLVVNATIRAVNNVTVSIPHRDLLQNEPVPNQQQQQQLLHRMERQGGGTGDKLEYLFL